MTPLAHRILNETTLPKKDRTFLDTCNMLPQIAEARCFECSAIIELMFDMFGEGKEAVLGKSAERYSFLPAPVTWIEFKIGGSRCGYLLWQEGDWIRGKVARADGDLFGSQPFMVSMPHITNKAPECAAMVSAFACKEVPFGADVIEAIGDQGINDASVMLGLLAFINTPRIIERTRHDPHTGLQKKLARAKGETGKAFLHPWHEIRLVVATPAMGRSAAGEPHGTRLTGPRAEHFVRSHLRPRNGLLVLVSAHKRGDPALGTRQARYRVVPEAAD